MPSWCCKRHWSNTLAVQCKRPTLPMNLPLYIARRLHGNDEGGKKVSKPAIRIATIGVAVGLAVMIVSVCVVLGFKHTVRDKVVGFGSHIQVQNYLSLRDNGNYPIVVNDSVMQAIGSIDGVEHVQRYANCQGILKTDSDFLGVQFKGVGPEYDRTFIAENIKSGEMPVMSDSTNTNRLVISQLTANKLKVKVGDKLFAYFIDGEQVRTRRMQITGIYETNLKQYDEMICLTDLYAVQRLNAWERDQASGAEVTVKEFDKLKEMERKFINQVDRREDAYGNLYSSVTITKSNPQIFTWLDLLDLNVWIILALMVALSGFTMVSGLLIIILERTQMIGVLKALGARNSSIRHTFLWFSVFIMGRGMLVGNIVGIGLCLLQHLTGMVQLNPSTYYVTTVPVEINVPLIVLINIGTLIVSVLVLVAPSFLISHIQPSKSMRYE